MSSAMTSTVEMSIQAVSPLSTTGGGHGGGGGLTMTCATASRLHRSTAPGPARRQAPTGWRSKCVSVSSLSPSLSVLSRVGGAASGARRVSPVPEIRSARHLRWPRLSRSPVRTRTACSTGRTKILPSPILPVWACRRIVSTTELALLVVDDDVEPELGYELHDVFGAPIDVGVAALPSKALDLGHHQPLHARARQRHPDFLELVRLITAMISFIPLPTRRRLPG